jgi:hypothetical protein
MSLNHKRTELPLGCALVLRGSRVVNRGLSFFFFQEAPTASESLSERALSPRRLSSKLALRVKLGRGAKKLSAG